MLVNRRYCITAPGVSVFAPKKDVLKPVYNNNVIESDTLYFYQNERFKTLYMLSDENGRCVTIRRRVEWFDVVSDKVKYSNESTIYITGTEEL